MGCIGSGRLAATSPADPEYLTRRSLLVVALLKLYEVSGDPGTLAEAKELIALARAGKIAAPPIAERPFNAAQATLDDLRAGRIVGRVVLAA